MKKEQHLRSTTLLIKQDKDKQLTAFKQIKELKYQIDVERNGGIYYIATDFTSFLQWFIQSFGEVEK
ncbi:MAG: hypothetical protein HXX14_01815 [Bacteroidetes bacterium]|nr:hypothetical protein [Bacteroidota bacterium]